MKNLRVTAMVAGALVGGLVLGGVGIATAATHGMTPTAGRMGYSSVDTTPVVTPPSGDATPVATPPAVDTTPAMTPPSGDTTQPMTPPSDDSTPTMMPPSGDTTPSMSPAGPQRPPMPVQAHGHAYGRTVSHPHSGLHRGRGHAVATHASHAASHAGGSMMGR
jgi:hypothetical protein